MCRPQILKERKNLLLISVLFLLGLLIYLYLPIRASISPKVNWGNPDNLERFLDHVRRRQYGKLSKDSRTISLFFQQIWEYIKLIGKEFSPFLGLISIAGIICLYKTHKKYFILTVSLFLILSVGFIFLLNFKITAASVMSVSEFLPHLILFLQYGLV